MAATTMAVMGAQAMVSPAAADFLYEPPAGPRPSFTVLEDGDALALARVLDRLAPPGTRFRYDRRVAAGKRIVVEYVEWRSLLFGEGLAYARHGDEIHIRPAGLPAGEVELVAALQGWGVWSIRAGELLRAALTRWGDRAGVDVLFLTDRAYRLEEDRAFHGEFVDAVGALLLGLLHLPHPPAGELSSDGGVLTVTHRLRPDAASEAPAAGGAAQSAMAGAGTKAPGGVPR